MQKRNFFPYTLGIFFISYTLCAFFKISSTIVIPIFIEKFSISSSLGGILSGAYYIPYAVMQLFAGPLSHKYGPHKVISLGFAVAFTGSLMFAFASNAFMVFLGRFLIGCGVGPVFISVLSYISGISSGRRFAILSGLAVTFSALGQVIASAPLKFFIERFGIKTVFLVLSLILAGVSVVLIFTKEKTVKSDVTDSGLFSVFRKMKELVIQVIKSKIFASMTVSWILYNSIQHSYQGLWSTKWFSFAYPQNISISGLSATLVSFGLMAGTFLSERFKRKSVSRTHSTILSELLFSLLAILVPLSHFLPYSFCFVVDFFLGFFVGCICIQQTAFVREFSDASTGPSIIGSMNFCSSLGTVLFQWATGLSFDLLNANNPDKNNCFIITFVILALINLLATVFCIKRQKTATLPQF